MTDAVPEQGALEEGPLVPQDDQAPSLPEGVNEADALDQYRGVGGQEAVLPPSIADGVNEADALEQAMVVAYDDEDDWRD